MKSGLISKIIKLCIIVLLPLLAGVFTGIYAYGNYQDRYFDYYMEEASQENTEDRLVSYLDYINEYVEYEKKDDGYDFYFSEKFSNDQGELFTVSIIRAYEVKNEAYYNKKGTYLGTRDTYYMTYYFAIYNVNYETLAKTIDPSGEHKLLYTELPKLSVGIKNTNAEEDDPTITFETDTVASVTAESNLTTVFDYGYSPEKDSKGDKLNAGNPTSMRYYVLPGSQLDALESEVTIEILVDSNWAGDDQAEQETVATFEKTDFYGNKTVQDSEEIKTSLESFNKVYNEDIFAAGYNKFVFGRYIWWQVLIAVVLFVVVCGSFVLVWNAEEAKLAKEAKKGKK